MRTLISIDPGMSTGIAVGTYSDTEPYRMTHVFQIEGGVEGFLWGVRVSRGEDHDLRDFSSLHLPNHTCVRLFRGERLWHEGWAECEENHRCDAVSYPNSATVIVEKFTARSVSQGGFSYRTRDLEPLRIEGAILAMGLTPTWVSPAQQYFSGGDGKAKKKQAQHAWLKENGLYVTGKTVGGTNADDVRSALAHSISYLRRIKHMPTIEHYFPRSDND